VEVYDWTTVSLATSHASLNLSWRDTSTSHPEGFEKMDGVGGLIANTLEGVGVGEGVGEGGVIGGVGEGGVIGGVLVLGDGSEVGEVVLVRRVSDNISE